MIKQLKYLLGGTLRRQLMVGMALIVSATMALFVWDMTRHQKSVEREQQSEQALALASSVATSSAVWLASRDFSGLQEIIEGLARYPDLHHAIVLDLNGQVLAHNDPVRRAQYLNDLPRKGEAKILQSGSTLLDVVSPVMLAGRQIGWVRIGLTRESLDAELAEVTRSAVLYALASVALSVLFSALAGRYLTRRLAAIQRVANAVQTGEASERAHLSGEDEAAQLARQFNGMLDSLAQRKAALHDSFEALHSILETTLDGFWRVDSQGKLCEVNLAYSQQSGYSRDQLLGMRVSDLEAREDPTATAIHMQRLAETGRDLFETEHRRKDGSLWSVEVSATTSPGAGCQFFAFLRDISGRKQAAAALQHSERQLAVMLQTVVDGIVTVDLTGQITYCNQAARDILGIDQDLVGRFFQSREWRQIDEHGQDFPLAQLPLAIVLRDQRTVTGIEHQIMAPNGEHKWLSVNAAPLLDEARQLSGGIASFRDITAIKRHASELERVAHFDLLTNLPNRLLLADRLQQSLVQAERRGQTLAVAYLDLDGFKTVNDRHGHAVGDQLLIALAVRMKQAMRDGDTIARIGGDEFVAVLVDLANVAASEPMLARLLAAAAQPVQVGELQLQVSASLGVTFYPQAQALDADQMLRQADQAMYQAKLAGKNRYHVFDAEHDSSLRVHHESLERIRHALDAHEFVLYYQPKVNMRSGKVIGAEALIRWQHPERGLLAPAHFLPVIEDHPLAIAIGEWVIETALTQVQAWRAAGLDLPISVNVGASQLQQANFVERLRALLAAHPQVTPSYLELEILETSALEDVAQIAQLIAACAEFGVTFALDDFGTGYSSLTYLKRLRVTMLKIDQSFVRDMLENPDDLAILKGVISLAGAFHRQVIAEGVETIAHGTLLLQLGCDLAQGYGIARPMTADSMPAWAASWQPEPAWSDLPWLGGGD